MNNSIKKGVVVSVLLLFISVSVVSSTGYVVIEKNSILTNVGNIIYVDDDNTAGPWDGTLEHPYQYIQDAVNHIDNGDTIFVFNGTYAENLDLDFDENIHFNLTGENKHNTVINGSITLYYTKVVVRINGFKIEKSINIWSGTEDGNIVTDCIFVSGGIKLDGSSHSKIINNTFQSNYILLESSSYNVITGNTFFSGGIFIVRSDFEKNWNTHTIENNTIKGKTIRYYKKTNDITVPNDTGQLILSHCYNFTIQDLIISDVEFGIQLAYSSNNIISNCTITNASSEGSATYRPTAIDLHRSNHNIISKTVINNFFIGIDCDISGDNTISESTIMGGVVGIQINQRHNNIISRNMIADNEHYGIAVYLGSSTIVDGNIIQNNSLGLYFDGASYQVVSNNAFHENDLGLRLLKTRTVRVKKNNFIDNNRDVSFSYAFSNIFRNRWIRNYWDNNTNQLVYCVQVTIVLTIYTLDPFEPPITKTFSWINFDWFPAQEPYDIDGGDSVSVERNVHCHEGVGGYVK